MGNKRGILMHISSLPSAYGIGDFGREAFEFVDFLKSAGQSFWQILPQNPTGFGDSPYQSASAFAGNPYFIDIDALCQEGLLKREEIDSYFFGKDPEKVDYEKLFFYRYPLLRSAFLRFEANDKYQEFIEKNSDWLEEYALFMALKEKNHYNSWVCWDNDLKKRDKNALDGCRKELKKTIDFYKFVQFKFFEQWYKLKEYANSRGIQIIGDMPIYVSMDSSEVWSERELFQIDENDCPKAVAGYAPDDEYKSGQLWGNPLYSWEEMKKQGYKWWIRRIKQAEEMYDMVRIDHFCGFFDYYSVEPAAHDARCGVFKKAPGEELFEVITSVSDIKIIAENPGRISKRADNAMEKYGFYGMNILEHSLDFKNVLWNRLPGSVYYTSTHDTDTIRGWYESLSKNKQSVTRKVFSVKRGENPAEAIIKYLLLDCSDIAIVPIQDYLGLGSKARMNIPSTLGGNWLFRVKKEDITQALAKYIKEI